MEGLTPQLYRVASGIRDDIDRVSSISTRGGEAESPDTRVDSDAREASSREAIGDVRTIDRNEDAADVDHPVQQIIFNFECQKRTTGTQDAKRLAKSVFLSGACAEMVQHQNRYGGRKSALCERKRRGVTLHDCVSVLYGEPHGERVAPFEARHARGKSLQRLRAGARSCTQLKHMVAQ